LKEKRLIATHLLKNKQGKAIKEKIESVDVLQKPDNGDLNFLAIADNDNGTSKLFHLRLRNIK
jgi:hypothetical protein